MLDRLKYFRQLSWKLTLSYTIVTVSALVIGGMLLLGLIVVITLIALGTDTASIGIVRELRGEVEPQIRPFLEESPPDAEGLSEWLKSPAPYGLNAGQDSSLVSLGRLVITDSEGIILTTYPDYIPSAPVGEPFDPEAIPGTAGPFEHALAGDQDERNLFTPVTGRITVAIPIMDEQNKNVLGVMVLDSAYIDTLPIAFSPMVEGILYGMLCLVVIAGGIGTVFGFVTARGLTKRLKSLTAASDAWSQGQFTVFVEDRSADEIGQLSARLNRMAQQLQNLLDTRQELAVVEERNRLARDLHDSAKQQAFAASAQIAAARAVIGKDPDAASKHLAEAESLVNALRKELGVLIAELRPAALGDRGLAAALRDYAAEWSRQSGIEAEVRLQGEHALPLDVEQVLYRIVQEALANVARHSGAGHADLWLGYEPDAITLTITDDGSGFDASQKTGGVGLSSMRERSLSVGGSLDVQTGPSGTKITARCPLNQTSSQGDTP